MKLADAGALLALLLGASVILALLGMLFGELRKAGGARVTRAAVLVWMILAVEASLVAVAAEVVSVTNRFAVWLIGGPIFVLTFVVLTLRLRRLMRRQDIH